MYATISVFCILIGMNHVTYVEIQFNSSLPNPRRRENIKLNFYFNTKVYDLKLRNFINAWEMVEKTLDPHWMVFSQ